MAGQTQASVPNEYEKSQHAVSYADSLGLINNPINLPQIYYGDFIPWGSKIILIVPLQ